MFLSLVLCSRNDNYLGNSLWRLETTLNYISDEVFDSGFDKDVEIILTDWGSERCLRNSLRLSNTASHLTKFLEIPPNIAKKLQKDSDFGEVLALNAAIRRSSGKYIGRIDQDTLVTRKFFEAFFALNKKSLPSPMNETYFFSARRHLPYDFVKNSPALSDVKIKLLKEGYSTKIEEMATYWHSPVGILLMHRDMWYDCGGFDERLIYYWWMDVDLGTRLIKKYNFINLGQLIGYEFFHLEHFSPEKCDGTWARANHKKLNPRWALETDNKVLNPNGDNWGLKNQNYELVRYIPNKESLKNPESSVKINVSTNDYILIKKQKKSFWDFLIFIKKRFPNAWIFFREFLKRSLNNFNYGRIFLDFFRKKIKYQEKVSLH